MPDGTKMFADVPKDVYDKVFEDLHAMRSKYPTYWDDQILVKMLCDERMKCDEQMKGAK